MTLSRTIATLIIEKNIPVEDVVLLLRKYNLLGLLPAIKDRVEELAQYRKSDNTLAIESPFPLSSEAVMRIKDMTGTSDSVHEITINKNILAGFKARFKGKLYDGSAERIMRQLIK